MNPRITIQQVEKTWIISLDDKEQWRSDGEYAKVNVEEYARWLEIEMAKSP